MNHMAGLVSQSQGKQSFDVLRQMIQTFVGNEETLLAKRIDAQNAEMDPEKLRQTVQWVNSENEVVKDALRLSGAAVDIETGLRGYLLTGKDEFLEPYRVGRVQFFQKTDLLRNSRYR